MKQNYLALEATHTGDIPAFEHRAALFTGNVSNVLRMI